jgi:hypothetical protein
VVGRRSPRGLRWTPRSADQLGLSRRSCSISGAR